LLNTSFPTKKLINSPWNRIIKGIQTLDANLTVTFKTYIDKFVPHVNRDSMPECLSLSLDGNIGVHFDGTSKH